ncbi:MAG: hypothetical protein FWB99_05440 [Treponema sp.]|nr:hypothetical protein [Treponema sp.]
MINLKAGGAIAIAAFILSLLIGFFSRTAMPMLIVRAILFAVLFFILSGMISFLVSRFLPELLADAGSSAEPDFFPGSQINIMEGETDSAQVAEAPPSGTSLFMGAQADDSEEGLGNISDLPEKAPETPSPGGEIQGIGLSGMDQNTQNGYNREGKLEEMPDPGLFTPWDPASFSGGASSGSTFVPQKPPASGGGGQSAAPAKSPEADFSGVSDSEDFFPDLDSMAGAFMPTSVSEGADAGEYSGAASSSKRSSRNSKNSGWSGDFSAKDMALGLRTALNKEKEG